MTVVGGNYCRKYLSLCYETIKKIPAAILNYWLSGVSLFCSCVYNSVSLVA